LPVAAASEAVADPSGGPTSKALVKIWSCRGMGFRPVSYMP
jgi:hypothetical protein